MFFPTPDEGGSKTSPQHVRVFRRNLPSAEGFSR